MDVALVFVIAALALTFDFTNGFHDAANAIATSVSTRALTPKVALAMAAVMNFAGALMGTAVAETIAHEIIKIDGVGKRLTLVAVLAALVGAIAWNLITWWFGLPSSSTHALVGGLVGAGLAGGIGVYWASVVDKVVLPMIISPIVGFGIAFLVMVAVLWIFKNVAPAKASRRFRIAQTASAAAMALGHGLQDAQKTMGVMFLATTAVGITNRGEDIPLWIILSAAAAISLGTATGGKRIMRTLGRRIIELDPARGFVAESVSAIVLYLNAFVLHAPVSTTHTITTAIMGVGATRRLSAVRWGVAKSIGAAWVLTIPAAASVAALVFWALYPLLG